MNKRKKPCLFCQIIRSEISAKIRAQTEDILAFEDINPQSPLHILIIPKKHIEKIFDLDQYSIPYIEKMTRMANHLAKKDSYHKTGYRLVINCGYDAGQSVEHLHMHLLAGRSMQWPPG